MANLIPIERLTVGSTVMINEGPHGLCAYVVEDIESLHHGEEFLVTFGDERGWSDTTSFEAGELVNAERKPLGLNDVTTFVCSRILSTAGLDAVREAAE